MSSSLLPCHFSELVKSSNDINEGNSDGLSEVSAESAPSVLGNNNNGKFSKIDNSDLTAILCNPITDLIATLRNSIAGVSFLEYYRRNRDFSLTQRLLLADVILDIEMRTNLDHL